MIAWAGGSMAVHFILDNVVEARVMGRRPGLSALVVFLSLLFWGALLGPVGMVICIPPTLTVRFACDRSEETRWISALLRPEAPQAGPPTAGAAPPP